MPSENSEELLSILEAQKGSILNAAGALLEGDTIKDAADRMIISSAVSFIENPTESLDDLLPHTNRIGMVCSGYDMAGAEIPPAIDAMHRHLLSLQCVDRIHFVESELGQASPDFAQIRRAMAFAMQWAEILSSGYKDNAMLNAVQGMEVYLRSKLPE